jgi:hypothetical protein
MIKFIHVVLVGPHAHTREINFLLFLCCFYYVLTRIVDAILLHVEVIVYTKLLKKLRGCQEHHGQ